MKINPSINFWACDLETTNEKSKDYQIHNEPRIAMFGAYQVVDGEMGEYYDTVDVLDMFNYMLENDVNDTIVNYFHNGSKFDAAYIIDDLISRGWKLNYTDELVNQTIRPFCSDNGEFFQVLVYYQNRTIMLIDSYKIINLAIKDLAEIQGLKKFDSAYNFEVYDHIEKQPPQERAYMKQDCLIMVQPLIDMYNSFDNVKLTAGSTSINALKTKIIKTKDKSIQGQRLWKYLTYCPLNEAADNLKYCFGGLNFVNENRQHKITKGCHWYDAKSFYPSQMALKPMIVSKTRREVEIDYECAENEAAFLEILIISAKHKYPQTGVKLLRNWTKQNKRMGMDVEIDLNNNDSYVWTIDQPVMAYYAECEFNELMKWIEFDYTIVKKVIYQTDWYMRDYINEMYDRRKAYKKNKDPREHNVKITLNSTFGKLMENPIKEELRFFLEGEKLTEGDIRDDVILLRPKGAEFAFKGYVAWVCMKANLPKTVRNPIIGAYITALARTELMGVMWKYKDDLVYGDTDSCCVSTIIDEFENGSGELGTWSKENEAYPKGIDVYVVGYKRYIAYSNEQLIKLGMCGASKDKFKKLVQALLTDEAVPINEAFQKMYNKELSNMKLSKHHVKGKTLLRDSTYQIKVKTK